LKEIAMTRIPIDDDDEPTEGDEQVLEDEAGAGADPRGPQGGEVDRNEFDKVRAERDMLYERLARAQADYQNSRNRLKTESDQQLQYANASLIKSLLPVIDNFERALAQDPDTTDTRAMLKGMQIVHDQWLNVLKQQQVREIAPQPGDPFNPTEHEALMQQPSDKFPPNSVTQTLQKGYALYDRTLRPAQVAVSK
jgi:molecular chaperone GrpE